MFHNYYEKTIYHPMVIETLPKILLYKNMRDIFIYLFNLFFIHSEEIHFNILIKKLKKYISIQQRKYLQFF